METVPKLVKAEPGEVEHTIQREISNLGEAMSLAKNILTSLHHYEKFTGKFGINAEGENILIFKLK
jgi:hypothetical protein